MNTVDYNEQMILNEVGSDPISTAADRAMITSLVSREFTSDNIDWQALVNGIVDLDRRRADELTRNARVGAFHRELVNFLDDYCGRVQAFVDNHPQLESECKDSLRNALESNAARLARLYRQSMTGWVDDIPF